MRWFLLTLTVSSIAAAILALRTRIGNRQPDVGAVSDQWVATHRSEQNDY